MSDSEESDYDFEPIEADESDDEIVPSTQKTDQKQFNVGRGRRNTSWLGDFQSRTGPDNCDLTRESSLLDYFSLIFPQDLVKSILTWTNARAKNQRNNTARRNSENRTWKDPTIEEMNTFIGNGNLKAPKL